MSRDRTNFTGHKREPIWEDSGDVYCDGVAKMLSTGVVSPSEFSSSGRRMDGKGELVSRDGHSSSHSRPTSVGSLLQHDSNRSDSGFGSLKSERLNSSDFKCSSNYKCSLDGSHPLIECQSLESLSSSDGGYLSQPGKSSIPYYQDLDFNVSSENLVLADRISELSLMDLERTSPPKHVEYRHVSKENALAHQAFQPDDDGDTALHLAIIQLQELFTLQLILYVPDILYLNLPNNLHQTPLHLAVYTNQHKIVRRLVLAGAATYFRDRRGNTPLHIACERGYFECAWELLRPVKMDEMDLQRGYSPYLQAQDMELRNYEGQMCMHLAVLGQDKKIIQLLRDYDADANCQEGKSGRTPLHYAVEIQNIELIHLLILECQANINARTFAGLTPIQLAYSIRNRNEQLVNCLLELGASDLGPPPSDSESDSSSDEIMKMEADDDLDLCINGQPLAYIRRVEVH